jgi:hypothetical protein
MPQGFALLTEERQQRMLRGRSSKHLSVREIAVHRNELTFTHFVVASPRMTKLSAFSA